MAWALLETESRIDKRYRVVARPASGGSLDVQKLFGDVDCSDCDCDCSQVVRELDKGLFIVKNVLMKQCDCSEGFHYSNPAETNYNGKRAKYR